MSRFLTTVWLIFALQTTAWAAASLSDIYQTKVLADINSSQIIQSNIKHKIRSACPQVRPNDLSSCFRIQVQPLQIKSSTHLLFLAGVAELAAKMDHGGGASEVTISLLEADNLLALLEKINLAKFHLNELPINTIPEYMGTVELKRQENISLAKATARLLELAEEQIQLAQPHVRQPSSAVPADLQVWQNNQLEKLTARLQKFKNARPLFSQAETSYSATRIFSFHFNEQERSVCLNPHTASCKQLSPATCGTITKTAFEFCDRRQSPSGGTFSQAQDALNYIRALNSCAAPLIRDQLRKAAPECH